MCDCIEQVGKSIFKLFIKDMAKVEIINPNCHFENLLIGGSSFPLYIPVKVDYSVKRKSGKKIKQSRNYTITPEFCPFCGVKTNDFPLTQHP